MTERPTTLLALLRECTPEQREYIAQQSGTSVNYLYALATCARGVPRADLAVGIEDASRRLNLDSEGLTRIVTVRDLAAMCSVQGLVG